MESPIAGKTNNVWSDANEKNSGSHRGNRSCVYRIFYLYSRSGDVYQSVDADLITLSSSGQEDIEIEKDSTSKICWIL